MYGYLLHANVLMDNHYHLLIETPHSNIKQVMQNINTSYTVYINKMHIGSVSGDETFREKAIMHIKGIPDKTEIPEIKKIGVKHKTAEIIKAVTKYYGVKEEELLKRKKATVKQRKKAIYFCKMLSGQTNAEVGRAFGITLQAVTNAVRDIEKKMAEDIRLNREMMLFKKKMDK